MTTKRIVDIFSAGCTACQDTIDLVNQIACTSCEINILDMHDQDVATRAKSLGVRSVPAVAINGQLVNCCKGRGVDESMLRAVGLGTAK